jgi:F-type H+-transporting ATPase subunit a
MASTILHIKDSYYFEVPKSIWRVPMTSKEDFRGSYETWLRLDPQFQLFEAEKFYEEYAQLRASPRPKEELIHEYVEWKVNHAHAGKPFWRFIAEEADRAWYRERMESPQFWPQWKAAIEESSGHEAIEQFRRDPSPQWQWSSEKLAAYSEQLAGKILIPQPFARLRNLYQKEWGVAISKFMIIEVVVAIVLCFLFSWLAKNVQPGGRPRGVLWNLLEMLVVFVRDEIARPAIGHHEPARVPESASATHVHPESHSSHGETSASHAHGGHSHADNHSTSHKESHEDEHGHEDHDPRFDADRFVPLLLTIFFFILGCNLAGLIPWVGAPTGEWGTTSAIAFVTFATGVVFGMMRFGVLGYFGNQLPPMDLPIYMAVILKPMILVIEVVGLLIKHAVLSIRLLANMVAGHIVLLSIMALAFSLQGASSSMWPMTAMISIVGSTLLSCLELFVAVLQAYIFTFLSAMFIGAVIHHH